jgi:hypothetical protein
LQTLSRPLETGFSGADAISGIAPHRCRVRPDLLIGLDLGLAASLTLHNNFGRRSILQAAAVECGRVNN